MLVLPLLSYMNMHLLRPCPCCGMKMACLLPNYWSFGYVINLHFVHVTNLVNERACQFIMYRPKLFCVVFIK